MADRERNYRPLRGQHALRRCAISGLILALLNAGLMCPALAQTAPSDSIEATTLDQITVTARQRSERLQDVPIAVTAFNAADIRNAGISRPRDFIGLTPNVSFSESAQSVGTAFITIRGIAQVRNSEQPVAVVVDGVPQINAGQFNQELFDIAQVEVLKGPQGAMYGNNSIGGAITITTTEPSDTVAGYVQLGAGNGGLKRGQGSVGGALDAQGRWRGSVSAFYSDFDGLIKNEYLNKMVNNLRSYGGRMRLLGQPMDALRVDLQLSDSDDKGGSLNHVFQPFYGINDAGVTGLPITANNHGVDLRKNSQASFKLDWQRPWGNVTSISAWSRVSEYTSGDQFPYTPATTLNPDPDWPGLDGLQTQYMYVSGLSQELRLTSGSDQRLRWIAGVYGQFVDRYISSSVGEDLELGMPRVLRAPSPAGSISPTTDFLADDNANDTYAVFGQLAYDITPTLEAALAMRYDYAKRKQTNVAPPEFSASAGQVRKATFSAFQPKISLTFKPHVNFTGFASLGRGFNSGGFNQNGVTLAATAAGISGVSDQYGQETADAFELGIKTRPLNWLEFNASAFYTNLENQHYFVFIGEVSAQVIAPIDKTRLQGVELELKAIPARNLSLLASYGYTDSEIRKNSADPTTIGKRSPYVAQSTLNLGAQYKLEVAQSADAVFRVDYRRMGQQYWDTLNSTARPAVELLDARVIVQPVSGYWSLTLWGRNLNNAQYLSSWVLGGFADPALPRTYGADFRLNF